MSKKVLKCACCERTDIDLRCGICFQCCEIQSIIVEGLTMYDLGLDKKRDNVAKTSMDKVKLLIQCDYIKFYK